MTKADKPKDDGSTAWQKLAAQTRRLTPAQKNRHVDAPAKPARKKSTKSVKNAENAAGLGANSMPAPPKGADKKPEKQTVPLDTIEQKARRRLSRGRDPIDGTLDMHGMTLKEGEAALRGFVGYHSAQGHKWVLVITGKGVRGEGRLRAALPEWLARAPLAGQIVEYDQAAMGHGGSGAFYLRLRRAKK